MHIVTDQTARQPEDRFTMMSVLKDDRDDLGWAAAKKNHLGLGPEEKTILNIA